MKKISVALMLTGAFILPAWAHHSGTMFDPDREVTFEGVVNEFQYTNPHSWLLVDVTNEDGTVTTWGFENRGSPWSEICGHSKERLTPGHEGDRHRPSDEGRASRRFVCQGGQGRWEGIRSGSARGRIYRSGVSTDNR